MSNNSDITASYNRIKSITDNLIDPYEKKIIYTKYNSHMIFIVGIIGIFLLFYVFHNFKSTNYEKRKTN